MKTTVSFSWIPGLMLATVWLPAGFAQQDTNCPASPDTSAAEDSSSQATAPPATQGIRAIGSAKDFPALPLPETAAIVSRRQPPKMRLSPWTSEVLKLAESGIETGVILGFIENAGTFNLSADQIMYLNDLGLPGEIINGMLQHDRDVITGAKPLTITSEPEWPTPFEPAVADQHREQEMPSPKPKPAPPASSPAPVEPSQIVAGALYELTASQAAQSLAKSEEFQSHQPTRMHQRAAGERGSALTGGRNPYPVREPYPVEITAPIFFIKGDGRVANTLVILGFPRSNP